MPSKLPIPIKYECRGHYANSTTVFIHPKTGKAWFPKCVGGLWRGLDPVAGVYTAMCAGKPIYFRMVSGRSGFATAVDFNDLPQGVEYRPNIPA